MNELSWYAANSTWEFMAFVVIFSFTFSTLLCAALLFLTHNKKYFDTISILILGGFFMFGILIYVFNHMEHTDAPKNWFSRLPKMESQYMEQSLIEQDTPITLSEFRALQLSFQKSFQNYQKNKNLDDMKNRQLHWMRDLQKQEIGDSK